MVNKSTLQLALQARAKLHEADEALQQLISALTVDRPSESTEADTGVLDILKEFKE
jgi:hypothetical protein